MLHDRIYFLFLALGYLWLPVSVDAELRIGSPFGNNMVLQRNQPLPIWGWTNPDANVSIRARDQFHHATADQDGSWQIILKPMDVGEPFTIQIQTQSESLELKNVVVGEVWLCSGQSNMEWTVNGAANPSAERAAANYPLIRHIKVLHQRNLRAVDECETTPWEICTPETAGEFSAVGYYFGRRLHQDLKVPIGLINSTWGGTVIESWTSADSLESHQDFTAKIAAMRSASRSSDIEKWQGPNHPTLLYNAMIHPLVPLAHRGVIWYQGEANAGRAFQYRQLFPLMINDWRNKWRREFPFYWVQLASFRKPSNLPADSSWAELREAQTMASSLPMTGQAVIIDIGDANDIHPKNKQDVGKRLALIALKNDYGFDVDCDGPQIRNAVIEGNQIRIKLDHNAGLKSSDGKPLQRFEVAGADRRFHWAKASIDGGDVIVSADEVTEPVAVRYAWADNPEGANLTNRSGLPACPFRTDDWPGITIGNK